MRNVFQKKRQKRRKNIYEKGRANRKHKILSMSQITENVSGPSMPTSSLGLQWWTAVCVQRDHRTRQ